MRGVSEQYVKGHSGDQLFFVAFAQVGSLQHSHWYHLFVHIYSSGAVDLLVKLWRRQQKLILIVQAQLGMKNAQAQMNVVITILLAS